MEFKYFLGYFVVILGICLCSSEARIFYVGGRSGWVLDPPENYNHWAERNRFQVNDTLYFKYTKGSDSVLIVTEKNYNNCNTTAPLQALTEGDSEFKFNRSGPFFFISGNGDHCCKGQKLIVVVLAVRHHPTPPPSKPPTTEAPKPSPPMSEPPANEPYISPSHIDAPALTPLGSYASKFSCSIGPILSVIIGATLFLSSSV